MTLTPRNQPSLFHWHLFFKYQSARGTKESIARRRMKTRYSSTATVVLSFVFLVASIIGYSSPKMAPIHLLSEHGESSNCRSVFLALSICLVALLLMNKPLYVEGETILSLQKKSIASKSGGSYSERSSADTASLSSSSSKAGSRTSATDSPPANPPSEIILQYHVDKNWTKHTGMRRAASEPIILNKALIWTEKQISQGLRDLHWYTEREETKVQSFEEAKSFVGPRQQGNTAPHQPPKLLPDAKLFRKASPGWKSIMAAKSFNHFDEQQVDKLSLRDTADLFAFAQQMRCTSRDDDSKLSCKAFNAVEVASRSVVDGIPSLDGSRPRHQSGSMDALHFCGAMRLFADWRVRRQILPTGYATYATGVRLGHKDILLNVEKIENAARAWIERRKSAHGIIKQRPTLRDLLLEEIETNVHTKGLPKLEDGTAAVGLLWARRQLEYQHQLYRNINSSRHRGNIREAVKAAYDAVYSKYHGWGVRKVFQMSASAAPPLELLIGHMTEGRSVDDGKKEMAYFSAVVGPVLDDTLNLLHEMNMHDEGTC